MSRSEYCWTQYLGSLILIVLLSVSRRQSKDSKEDSRSSRSMNRQWGISWHFETDPVIKHPTALVTIFVFVIFSFRPLALYDVDYENQLSKVEVSSYSEAHRLRSGLTMHAVVNLLDGHS
ncbi:hypothetical protein BV22DRAFT_325182 [Leucogyrophana mollusca]|uniref:Uncharacterized protein n=1 Tax=Leucogyrophana mollusca TaxID=85980 RepID=A0ACB8BLQ9_9AGAM|nr:hypothetical protein BV22DRAFT_325182 [Leucogyrophana mollusca]